MSNKLIETIISGDKSVRNRSITSILKDRNKYDLLNCADELESFRQSTDNLYHKVRAALFLYVIYRFYLENNEHIAQSGKIPFNGIKAAFERDFEKAISIYLIERKSTGSGNSALFSAIADSYYRLSFKCLIDQVKLSISHCSENYNLYNVGTLNEYPFSVPAELTTHDDETDSHILLGWMPLL
jgi:hypothetical protein